MGLRISGTVGFCLYFLTSTALAEPPTGTAAYPTEGAPDHSVAPLRQAGAEPRGPTPPAYRPPYRPLPYRPPAYRPPAYVPPAYAPVAYGPTPTPPPSSPHHAPASRWYGWQTLIADGGSVMLGVVASTSDAKHALIGLASLNYFLTPPIIHLAHDRGLPALTSLAMRPGLPLLGGLAGATLGGCGEGFCGGPAITIGLIAGYAAAVTIDVAALSWAPAERKDPQIQSHRRSFMWTPTAAADSDSVSLGVAGLW